ncbi:TlpA family protein disulfide reductase [Ferrimonas futtsuensis]|uniref:TlpA family protein disulfide reductase n=1 Tax=Ferrimonas futtsuensis TaxID=364764 RepID=UPI0003FC2252|nr:TlpA disulfide reductase family protein [Ferrimonas futtsuensis]
MRTLLLTLLLLLPGAPLSARPAPDFLIEVAGQSRSMVELSQQGPVYVDFWASWCGPCRRSFPFMNQLLKDFGPKGVTVVAINLDVDKADAAKFLEQFPADFPIVYDPEFSLADAYGVGGMPSSYLIQDGIIIQTHVGFRPKDAETTRATLENLINQRSGGSQ